MVASSFSIGHVRVSPPTVLAPLAGITNPPFRAMIKRRGCGLVYSEMVSANGLVYGSDKTLKMLECWAIEKPLAIQIFGGDPDIMAEAARMVQDTGVDILDINFGCSVKKVVKARAGVDLMRDPERSEAILTAVRKAVKIPLTIKIRTGWEASGAQAFRMASMAEHCGVDALCLHPRTATQGFSGKARWALIADMKKHCTIPLIGNGDITSPELALRMMEDTGCDGVMIGRAALHDPDLFRRTALCLEGGSWGPMTLAEHFAMMELFSKEMVDYHGEAIACKMMRGRLGSLVKGLPGSGSFRRRMTLVSSVDEARDMIRKFRGQLEAQGIEQVPPQD